MNDIAACGSVFGGIAPYAGAPVVGFYTEKA
jgi:hypothetical protein